MRSRSGQTPPAAAHWHSLGMLRVSAFNLFIGLNRTTERPTSVPTPCSAYQVSRVGAPVKNFLAKFRFGAHDGEAAGAELLPAAPRSGSALDNTPIDAAQQGSTRNEGPCFGRARLPLFSPCYLVLEKSSKSLISRGNCLFLRNGLHVFVGKYPCFRHLTARMPSTAAAETSRLSGPTTRPAPLTWRRLAGATGAFAPIVRRRENRSALQFVPALAHAAERCRGSAVTPD